MRKRRLKKQNTSKFPKIITTIAVVVIVLAGFSLLIYMVMFLFPKSQQLKFIVPYSNQNDVSVLKKDLHDVNLFTDSVVVATDDASIVVKLTNGPTVYFSPDQDFKTQVSSLQLIVSRLTIEKKQPNIVDLRYDKPIVKF